MSDPTKKLASSDTIDKETAKSLGSILPLISPSFAVLVEGYKRTEVGVNVAFSYRCSAETFLTTKVYAEILKCPIRKGGISPDPDNLGIIIRIDIE